MPQFSKEAENRLLSAVRAVVAGIEEGGLSPTDSVIKVAREQELGPPMIQLVVQACNVGRAAYHREKHATVLDKTAEFPLARYEDVMAAIYPSKPEAPAKIAQASAVSDEYSRPPTFLLHRDARAELTKTASVKLPPLGGITGPPPDLPGDPDRAFRKRAGARQKAVHAAEEARRKVAGLQDRMVSKFTELRDYFKQADALPLSEVRYNAYRLIGLAVQPLLDYVKQANRMAETQHTKQAAAVRLDEPPYTLLADCQTIGQEALAAKDQLKTAEEDLAKAMGVFIRPFVPTPTTESPLPSILGEPGTCSKTAGLFGNILGGAIGGSVTQALTPKPTHELVQSARERLDTPDQSNELRQIQSRAMLSDFLSHDEVIAGHPPEAVTEAFNEISQLSPRVATQPGLMRAMLRKRLTEGQLAPFEGEQLANIEKTLRQTEAIRSVDKAGEVLHGRTSVLD